MKRNMKIKLLTYLILISTFSNSCKTVTKEEKKSLPEGKITEERIYDKVEEEKRRSILREIKREQEDYSENRKFDKAIEDKDKKFNRRRFYLWEK